MKKYFVAILLFLSLFFYGCGKNNDPQKDNEEPQVEDNTNKGDDVKDDNFSDETPSNGDSSNETPSNEETSNSGSTGWLPPIN